MINKLYRSIRKATFNISILEKIEKIRTKYKTNYYRKLKNITLGKNCSVFYKSSIINLGRVIIGNNVKLGRSHILYHAGMPFFTTLFTFDADATIKIGDNCRVNGAYIHAQKEIFIGNNCVIASGVNIIDSNGHELISKNRTIGRDKPKSIEIGNNVWIGLNVTILKGTSIGNNCVIAAGSVVKGEFPDNVLIQGNPAVIVSKLEI